MSLSSLIKMAKTLEKTALIVPILDFIVAESQERTQMCVDLIISYMKKEDGDGLKPAFRGAAILCQVRRHIN